MSIYGYLEQKFCSDDRNATLMPDASRDAAPAGPARSFTDLENTLRRIDGSGYKAYTSIEGIWGHALMLVVAGKSPVDDAVGSSCVYF